MKKILISLAMIAAVGAIVVGATTAYFSDTETSTGNTFTAGTIDIAVDNQNPWTNTFTLADMKPGYTDNITFDIQNTGSGANPVDVYKKITNIVEGTGTQSEPECAADAENGTWNESTKTCTSPTLPNDDLSSQIIYDLNVEVYQGANKIWWQTLYLDSENKTIDNVYDHGQEVYLGMIPAGGHMIVKQSYHFKEGAGNVYQGDKMTFNIQVRGEQLQGTAVLENKTGAPDWDVINSADDINGTLTYKVKNPTFDFSFTGKALLPSTTYYLVAGWKAVGGGYDVDTKLGVGTSGSDGTIAFSGNVELGKDMKNVKVWLVPAENWTEGAGMNWFNWPTCVPNILWETGLIWYDDTNN